jgi:hypothetical protein
LLKKIFVGQYADRKRRAGFPRVFGMSSRAVAAPPQPTGAPFQAYEAELSELVSLAEQFADYVADWDSSLNQEILTPPGEPLEIETRLEEFTCRIRQAWLAASAQQTSRSFRSPKERDVPKTLRGSVYDFGYERELSPTSLERRCAALFEEPPRGVFCEHVLFSSGQAEMTACLLNQNGGDIHHLGGILKLRN